MKAILNDIELEARALEAGQLVQEIQSYCRRDHKPGGRIGFPSGFLMTFRQHRDTLPASPAPQLNDNLSYALMTADVLWWLLSRTGISGQAKDMLIKECICTLGRICEALTIRKGVVGLTGASDFKTRTRRLAEMGVLNEGQKHEIDWVWDIRNRSHLAGVSILEWRAYTISDLDRAFRAYKDLRDSLKERYG